MVDRTKKDIVDAFNRLISKIEFDQITAKLIAEEAGISKATFYRYFKDKYEVMNYNYKALLDSCLCRGDCHNYRDLYFHLFYTAQKEWKYLRYAFHSTGVNSFENYIYEYSLALAERITKENRNGAGFTAEESLQCDVFCHGITFMYQNWIFGKYPISADRAADVLYDLMPDSLRHYWFLPPTDQPDSGSYSHFM